MDDLVEIYYSTLTRQADKFAPLHIIKTNRLRLSPWVDDECRQQRRLCRHLERKYKRTHDQSTCNEWVAQMRKKYELLHIKRDEYWLKRIKADGNSSSNLWKSLSTLLACDCSANFWSGWPQC